MALDIRNPQLDDPSRTTTANAALQTTPLPVQESSSVGGALISTTDTTALSPTLASVNFHNPPSSTRTEHRPIIFTNPPSATAAIEPAVSQDPQAPVNTDDSPFGITTAISSATSTAQPNALSQSSGLTHSQIVAVILVPIVALLIILVPVACIYTRRRRRLRRSINLQNDREMKTLSPPTTAGWRPMTPPAEHGIARRPVPTHSQTPIQEPDVIPRRSPTMNSGYYSGLDQSVTQHRPPVVDDPPPPYVPRPTSTQIGHESSTLNVDPPAVQRQLQPATLSEANLVAHAAGAGTEGPRSPFEDPEGDGVSDISSLEDERSRETGIRREGGRGRDVDEISLISAPGLESDRGRTGVGAVREAHQIV